MHCISAALLQISGYMYGHTGHSVVCRVLLNDFLTALVISRAATLFVLSQQNTLAV
jgi:hypothetical protein